MNNYKVTVLKGDGIGPEIVDECIKVLDRTGEKFGFSIDYDYEDHSDEEDSYKDNWKKKYLK